MNDGVPDIAFETCAFFRLWCVVELAAASAYSKPLFMRVGTGTSVAKVQGKGKMQAVGMGFEHKTDMLASLTALVDVTKSRAAVEGDRVRELAKVSTGHAPAWALIPVPILLNASPASTLTRASSSPVPSLPCVSLARR